MDDSISKMSFSSKYDGLHGFNSIEDMVENHMLKKLSECERWNNIPVPVKEMFDAVCEAIIENDEYRWRRKVNNLERFEKL